MNIVVITPNYPKFKGDGSGTAGVFVESFAETLRSKGHKVIVFTHKEKGCKNDDPNVIKFNWSGSDSDEKLSAMKLFSLKTFFAYLNLLKSGKRALYKVCKKHKIDHCICMWAVPSGYYARYVKKILGVGYSVWALGADIWTYPKYPVIRQVIKSIIRKADIVYADGVQLTKDVIKLAHKKCEFLPSSRDLRIAKSNKLVLDKKKKHFLFVGRYEAAKGPDVLLDAISLLKKRKDIHFHFFGGGNMEKDLKKKIKSQNLKNITFNGYIDPSGCKTYLSKVDYLVIPSRIDSIPVVLSDAMQMNCPVVATDVGDTGGLVSKYGVGLVVPSERPDILADALSEISKKDRKEFKKETDELYSVFDIQKVADRYLEAIRGILKRKS